MEKREFNLRNVLILVLLILGIGATTYLVLQRTLFETQAEATEDPKFITVSNENTEGFTISWITTKETQGTVTLINEGLTFAETGRGKTHTIKIDGLEEGVNYKFSVRSGSILDDNEGKYYDAFTSKTEPTAENKLIFGRIFGKESTIPLSTGFVTLQVEINGTKSNKILSPLNDQGGWQLDKSELLNTDLAQGFDTSTQALVTLGIFSPEITEPVYRTYDIVLDETLQLTDIFLGEEVPWELPAIEDETITTEE